MGYRDHRKIVLLFEAFFTAILLFSGSRASIATPQLEHAVGAPFELTIESAKLYRDPFNDVDIDIIFESGGQTWRVPAFWAGDSRWKVRFSPPSPGKYTYRWESTDRSNRDLNGRSDAFLAISPNRFDAPTTHGMIVVSSSRRYFQYVDGTPFFWLGEMWWTGLSDRLPWEGFKRLTDDRKAKGFTVVQICAGLVPSNE